MKIKHTYVCTHILISLPQKRSIKYISHSSEIHFFSIRFLFFVSTIILLFFTSLKGSDDFFLHFFPIFCVAYICSLYNLQGGNQTKERRGDKRRCVGCSVKDQVLPGLQPLQQQGAHLKHNKSPHYCYTDRGVGSQDTSKSQK